MFSRFGVPYLIFVVESVSPYVSMCLPAEWKDDAKLAICSYLQNWSNMFLGMSLLPASLCYRPLSDHSC